ncbi:MAG: hypothetical protein JSS79_05150 [Bacteroidetes bacterium]|nr:hypothetical protein [Bacteroidota bacterium]
MKRGDVNLNHIITGYYNYIGYVEKENKRKAKAVKPVAIKPEKREKKIKQLRVDRLTILKRNLMKYHGLEELTAAYYETRDFAKYKEQLKADVWERRRK